MQQDASSDSQSTSPYFNEEHSADVVNARMGNAIDSRLKQVMSVLVKHLHAAVKEIEPTHEEWLAVVSRLIGNTSVEQFGV
ncbi:hypothetical protein L0Z26_02695 [Burkholderia multivorans]|uniref:dioxygenase n=1 Tax=Burkholderia multivorans TaxID=87883 RepID=UPI002018A47F|nr:dioxygenase [Burkholderia multivorans]MCO1340846.1 hypothetical protein [Burkholderia multivorans]MCO1439980.1 hypothetical protein [Burkholderia multivorans]UQO31229.1 hypothetical protein L0Z21_27295 [Burkholderia multivorans]UQO44356.1 hypothetical protein L0Z43_27040 [Burkholderia multivorans]